jgi:hypothetical protein
MNEKQLDEIEARAKAATPGQWCQYYIYRLLRAESKSPRDLLYKDECDGCSYREHCTAMGEDDCDYGGEQPGHNHDPVFIANAREDVLALVATLRKMQECITDLGAEIVALERERDELQEEVDRLNELNAHYAFG